MKISGKTRLALLIGIGLLSGNVIRQRYFPTPLMPSRFIQAGHDVDAIAFSSDGSAFMASRYYGAGEMSLWSSTSKKPLHQWPVDAIKVWLSPDGRQSLNTKPNYKNDTTICTLRDTTNGKVIRSWQIEGSTSAVSRDRTMLVSVKYVHRKNNKRQAIIYLNDVGSGRVRSRYLADDPYGSYIAFSRDGQYITVPSFESKALLLRVRDMKPVLQLPRLKNLRLSRDSRRVIGISDDATLHMWQLSSGQQTQVRTSLTRGGWLYTNDENLIVISGEVGPRDNSQYLTEVRSADGTQLLRSFSGPIEAISPSGNLLVSKVKPLWKNYYFTNRNNYDVWDIRTGNRVARLNVSANPLGQPATELNILGDSRTFSPDEHQFVLSRHDGLISFYDLENRSSAPIEQSSNDSGRTVLEFKEVIAGASVMPDGSIEAYGTGAESNLHKTADPAGNVKSFSNALSGLGNDIALSDDSSSYNFNGSYSYKVWLRSSNAPAVLKVDGETGMRNVVLSKWNTEKATAETQVVASKAKKVGQQLFVLVGAVPVRGGQKLVVLWKKAQRQKDTDTSIK